MWGYSLIRRDGEGLEGTGKEGDGGFGGCNFMLDTCRAMLNFAELPRLLSF